MVVEDPTPTGAFSGSYVASCQKRGKVPMKKPDKHCTEETQDGHIAVYENGVIACNGSTAYAPYDQNGDGSSDPLQGYLWVGPDHAATGDVNAEAPTRLAGVGSNHGKLSHEPTGQITLPRGRPRGRRRGQMTVAADDMQLRIAMIAFNQLVPVSVSDRPSPTPLLSRRPRPGRGRAHPLRRTGGA